MIMQYLTIQPKERLKIFTENVLYTKKNSSYLFYIEKQYGLSTEKGIVFKPREEALLDFRNMGCEISEEEIKQLRFLNIKKSLNEM